jgi:hypothetical protein
LGAIVTRVPASFANRPVSLPIYPDRLALAAEGNILCEHGRVFQRNHQVPPRTIYDWRHYLAVLQRKPGALRNGAPFAEFPPAFRQLQDRTGQAALSAIRVMRVALAGSHYVPKVAEKRQRSPFDR